MEPTTSTNPSSNQEFTELLQRIGSPQAREFITWILKRLNGPDARAWSALLDKLFKGV